MGPKKKDIAPPKKRVAKAVEKSKSAPKKEKAGTGPKKEPAAKKGKDDSLTKKRAKTDGARKHYILMLDDSGSMKGQPWEDLKKCVDSFIDKLAADVGDSKLSVIVYNDYTRIVF